LKIADLGMAKEKPLIPITPHGYGYTAPEILRNPNE
jgi:hypothetical protein